MIARENTTFEAIIGPAANPRGYTGITGMYTVIIPILKWYVFLKTVTDQ